MGLIPQREKVIAIAFIVMLGAGAIALARPQPILQPVLGAEWQCSRAAFITTCNHRGDGASIPIRGPRLVAPRCPETPHQRSDAGRFVQSELVTHISAYATSPPATGRMLPVT